MSPLRRRGAGSAWLGAALSAILAGCAAPYVEPAGNKPTASIDFIDEAAYPMSLHFHAGAKECTDRTGAGLMQPKTKRTLRVPAGEDVVFTVGMDAGGAGQLALALGGTLGAAMAPTYRGCTPTIDFVPTAGRTYVFRMNSDGKDCSYRFYAQPTAGQPAGEEQVPFASRQWKRAMSEAGPWCAKKALGG